MVPVTRRGSCTRSRAWPEDGEEFPAVLVPPSMLVAPADELGGAVRAERAAEEQEERPSTTAMAATQARR
jgi:hypothetical protein